MLNIKTFTEKGTSAFFKALGHPEILAKRNELKKQMESLEKISIYDPESRILEFLGLMEIEEGDVDQIFVQKIEDLENDQLQKSTKLISKIYDISKHSSIGALLVLSFDDQKHYEQIKLLLPENTKVIGLSSLRLPDEMLTDTRNYLSPLNFATNFSWFREYGSTHTRITTANYWTKYGAKDTVVYAYLLNENGNLVKKWHENLLEGVSSLVIDSGEIRNKFGLGEFFGQLFLHFIHVKGHDIVKYALDVYSDDMQLLTSTHDANAWPSDYFAGLPAPKQGEKVLLWLQNSHPVLIKKGTISINVMGEDDSKQKINKDIYPYGTICIDIADYFSDTLYPKQLELFAGKYFVRPRYEIVLENGNRCMAHINVERDNLARDINLKEASKHLGKGFLLPAPILPMRKYTNNILPTPMSRDQSHLPIKAIIYDKDGNELFQYKFGNLPRNHSHQLCLNDHLKDSDALRIEHGSVQIIYDFENGDCADGWLHSIFNYHDRDIGYQAETSFGSHIFNNITTYKNEPQSYKGPPPGLSTSLFLRVGMNGTNTHCYLVYPVSNQWHDKSSTEIILCDKFGQAINKKLVSIPANGCFKLDCHEMFSELVRKPINNPYIIIRDSTCRLFGYHMLLSDKSFSLDHMFGF